MNGRIRNVQTVSKDISSYVRVRDLEYGQRESPPAIQAAAFDPPHAGVLLPIEQRVIITVVHCQVKDRLIWPVVAACSSSDK